MTRFHFYRLMLRAAVRLNAVERGIIARQTERALAGAERYGGLTIETDPRDFLDELAQELYDGIFYIEAEREKRGR